MKLKWSLEQFYFYLVSFIALILIIVGAVNLTRTAIAYVAPVYQDYNPFLYEDLTSWEEEFGPGLIEQEKARFDAISRENYRRRLMRDLFGSAAFLVVALPVYIYHWRKIPSLEDNS